MPGTFVLTRRLLRWACIRTDLLVPDPGAFPRCRGHLADGQTLAPFEASVQAFFGGASSVFVKPFSVVNVALTLRRKLDLPGGGQVLQPAFGDPQVGSCLVDIEPGGRC